MARRLRISFTMICRFFMPERSIGNSYPTRELVQLLILRLDNT